MEITVKLLDDLLNETKYEPAEIKINNIRILFDSYDIDEKHYQIKLHNGNSISAIIDI